MNGRVYDSTIGRFISADPNIFEPFDTQGFNRYSYVKNNPLKYTGPSGFETEGEYDGGREAAGGNDNQAEENDFNSSEESGDGSGDSFEDRARYDSRITEQNNKELSRLNLQYKVDTVINFIRDLFTVGDIVFGTLIGKRVGLAKGLKSKPTLSQVKKALREVHNTVGKHPKGKKGTSSRK
ncbi:RHS repeat-associated core domain-containing protein [Malaciobacter sp. WC5094]